MPRQRKPLLARLADLMSISEQELQSSLDSWPVEAMHEYRCWSGPRIITSRGSTRTTIGALFELILEQPLHKSWRPVRQCGLPECRNPIHYQLETVHHLDGTVSENLPLRCFRNHLAQQLAGEVEDDPKDVIDTVLSVDGGRDMTPEALSERFMGGYTPAQFAEALEAIHAQGL